MPRPGNIFKYVSIVGLKLLLLGFAIIFLIVIVPSLIDQHFFKSSLIPPLIIGSLPFIFFLLFYLTNLPESKFVHKLACCKYHPLFPYYYSYETKPVRNELIKMDKILKEVKAGDIILRRYNRYLDGIIFSENSYFTHVGICYRDDKIEDFQVLHATGQAGVHMSSLEDFCKCDHVALVRFSLAATEEETAIRKIINPDDSLLKDKTDLNYEEEEVFENLLNKTKYLGEKMTPDQHDAFLEPYLKVVLKRAVSLDKTPYDFSFNFQNFEAFSCIEYVWYCYKCLFPWHRIRVKDFEFFNWIRMPVIIPDVFIKNDFFSYVYCSLPGIESKMQLKKFVKQGNNQFLLFLLSMLIWNIVLLIVYHQIPDSVKSFVYLGLLQWK